MYVHTWKVGDIAPRFSLSSAEGERILKKKNIRFIDLWSAAGDNKYASSLLYLLYVHSRQVIGNIYNSKGVEPGDNTSPSTTISSRENPVTCKALLTKNRLRDGKKAAYAASRQCNDNFDRWSRLVEKFPESIRNTFLCSSVDPALFPAESLPASFGIWLYFFISSDRLKKNFSYFTFIRGWVMLSFL